MDGLRGVGGFPSGRTQDDHATDNTAEISDSNRGFLSSPSAVTVPKGGGAIQGIDEKFSVNPATGTASLAFPIFTSAGRQGFHPQLSLSYDSGAGNGSFGLGWTLSVPCITRKTAKGIPLYDDAEESDVFILSGAEDLVPVLTDNGGDWARDPLPRTLDDGEYAVHRYRPRIEGLFARIERWQHKTTGETHWRSTTRDNVTSIYGRSPESRIVDPADNNRIFQWLVEESYDDKGNVIRYEYKAEDDAGVAPTLVYEKNRLANPHGFANKYLKRIFYGNRRPSERGDWLFEVVLDYGEHSTFLESDGSEFDRTTPSYQPVSDWPCRADAFSSYKAGFEIRTCRLCRRVLMYHHFPEELGIENYLVRSTDFHYEQNPVATYLTGVTQTGYLLHEALTGEYRSNSLPRLDFEYSRPVVDHRVRSLDREGLENLPAGAAGRFQWVDLDGEGIPGLLSEQGGAWFYKPNLGGGRLGPLRLVAQKPSLAELTGGTQQLVDLAGDGQKDLVLLADGTTGFYERALPAGWHGFRATQAPPNVNWQDPNLRWIDLNGDGHADLLLTEERVLTWYASRGEDGFASSTAVPQPEDEEQGPQLVFADAAQSVYLADMSGDGLIDLVRIRNGEVCYWPNLGYGRFGTKVTMASAPWFDHPDQFDQSRILLADTDGSGTTDLLYLGRGEVRIWFNQSGNAWSDPQRLISFPATYDPVTAQVVDLLGKGTACLVWSSPLPADAHDPMRYIDLMGGAKPHLLTGIRNNMGLVRRLEYAPSTRFYVADREAGRPWITRLPFPVHVVERTETYDAISQTRLVSRYGYHHGYFDGQEREFHGFGRVQQWDAEHFEGTEDILHRPPVRTESWFHTGAYRRGPSISRQYADEYYLGDSEVQLLPDTRYPGPDDPELHRCLSAEEQRQACRALKGRLLRQEVYAEDGSAQAEHPYLVSEHAYRIRSLQPAREGQYAVFFAYQSEVLSYHYERNPADPRISHQLTLDLDRFGNPTRTAAIGYPRRGEGHQDEQSRMLATYAEADFRNLSSLPEEADYYRVGVLYGSRTYELIGLSIADGQRLFSIAGLRQAADQAETIPFEAAPAAGVEQKRLITATRSLYWSQDLTAPLALGEVSPQALPYESYRMVLTPGLIPGTYGDRLEGQEDDLLRDQGGYRRGQEIHASGDELLDNAWWAPSGQQWFCPTDTPTEDSERFTRAEEGFFLPIAVVDPFGNEVSTEHDDYHLLMRENRAPLGNVIRAENNYRLLQPWQVTDLNGNRTRVGFDALGLVVATAVMGKEDEQIGDHLDENAEFDPDSATIARHLEDPVGTSEGGPDPHDLLYRATSRMVYDLHRFAREGRPNVVWTLTRETHDADQVDGEETRIQHSFVYSNGFGQAVMTKVRAEPGPIPCLGITEAVDPRWVGNGRTVFDNKGKPVKQYEPFFSDTHDYEDEAELVECGVTPVLHYDPLGRLIRTDNPDGTFSKIQFDPWRQTTWDANDTVLDSDWLLRKFPDFDPEHLPTPPTPEQDAAIKAAKHAETPAIVHLDVLARTFLSEADNRDPEGPYQTRVELDIQGSQLSVTDHLGRTVMAYDYDMAGTAIHQDSMDAGERWTLNDVAGNPIRGWDSRGHQIRTTYDELRRRLEFHVRDEAGDERLAERTLYGESTSEPELNNLRGQVYHQYDGAGLFINHAFDFKGNPLRTTRQLLPRDAHRVNWSTPPALGERFTSQTTFDALNRPVALETPDGSVQRPRYNEAGLLDGIEANLRGTEDKTFVTNIDYNARGQRERIDYGNGTRTTYEYDDETFRLKRLRTERSHGDNPLQDLSYTYDPIGNITRIEDQAQQTIFFDNGVVDASCIYEYDALYRLTIAEGREHIGQNAMPGPRDRERVNPPHPRDGSAMRRYREYYSYDAVGNIESVEHRANGSDRWSPSWTRRYDYDPRPGERDNNQLRRTSAQGDREGEFSQVYRYDLHGNMTSMPHLPEMIWDFKDQLHEVDLGGGGRAYYVYDASGQRVRKVREHTGQGGQVTRVEERIYLGGYEVYRRYGGTDEDSDLERETLHIMDGRQRIALVETKTVEDGDDIDSPETLVRYQLANHLGSACLELDENGRIISYEEYYPYGGTSYQAMGNGVEASAKRYRYTGMERDEESGLNYHSARYYAPWLGRWTGCDPSGLLGAFNLYSYASNNPTALTDRNGLCTTFPCSDIYEEDVRTADIMAELENEFSNEESPVEMETLIAQTPEEVFNEIEDEIINEGLLAGEETFFQETVEDELTETQNEHSETNTPTLSEHVEVETAVLLLEFSGAALLDITPVAFQLVADTEGMLSFQYSATIGASSDIIQGGASLTVEHYEQTAALDLPGTDWSQSVSVDLWSPIDVTASRIQSPTYAGTGIGVGGSWGVSDLALPGGIQASRNETWEIGTLQLPEWAHLPVRVIVHAARNLNLLTHLIPGFPPEPLGETPPRLERPRIPFQETTPGDFANVYDYLYQQGRYTPPHLRPDWHHIRGLAPLAPTR
jgi:RHS repeat-associated protein